jgi:cytochrome c-type protein NapC
VSDEPGAGRESRLWRRPRARWLFGIPLGAALFFVIGVVSWAGFNAAVALSNTETFCISCHEMRDNVYAEYRDTIHDRNRTGVRATCPDCHVPKPWGHKMVRKIQATFNELPKHVVGYLDTKEKFEAKRRDMAESVWASMRASDSRECRNCHTLDHMDLESQDKAARRKHAATLEKRDKTCIDCHEGIAHTLPAIEAAATD